MSPKTTRGRTLIAGAPLVCAAWVALLVAPSPQAQAANGAVVQTRVTSGAALGSDSVVLSDAVALAVGPSPETDGGTAAPEDVDTAAPRGEGTRVAVSDVVMVVNDDGSATLSATFEGRGDVVTLKSVHVESHAGALDVASTQMWLPILPGTASRAGDASDAGGFVVPSGLVPGRAVHVQFQFDNDTCIAVDAQTIRRNSTHEGVFPTRDQLGPAKRTSASSECSKA